MQLKPLSDRVLVEVVEEEQKTQSGIYLPDTAQEKPQRGRIVAVGTGRVSSEGEKLPMNVKEGDVVIFAQYAGTEIKVDGSEYLIMSENEILAIVEG